MSTFIELTTDQTPLDQISIYLEGSGTFRIDWGDGNTDDFMLSTKTLTSSYTSTGNYTIRLYGDVDQITLFDAHDNLNLGGAFDTHIVKMTGIITFYIQDTDIALGLSSLTPLSNLKYVQVQHNLKITEGLSNIDGLGLIRFQGGTTSITGDFSDLSAVLATIEILGLNVCEFVIGDIADIISNMPNATYFHCTHYPHTYTSSALPSFADGGHFAFTNCSLTAANADDILNNFALTGMKNGRIDLDLNSGRTSASDAAYNSLIADGNTINL